MHDYGNMNLDALRAAVRERKLGADGTPGGRTSWAALADRATLTAVLTAHDAGRTRELPLADASAPASAPTVPGVPGDAAALLVQALGMLRGNAGLTDADWEKVRAVAAEEAAKNGQRIIVVKDAPGAPQIDVGRAHASFPRLLEVLQAGLIPYLLGPPGTGKTHACQQAAKALDMPFEADSFNEQTPDYRISGFKNAAGEFVETPFYRASTGPGLYLGDEIDKAAASVTGAFNMALSNGCASFACGVTTIHEGTRFVFAGNTAGLGATPQYPDRQVLPMDFRDRFVFIDWPVDESLERDLALAHNPKAGEWVAFVQKVRANIHAAALPLSASPRASITGARLLGMGWTWEDTCQAALWRHAPASVVKRARGEA